ncbi:MAG: thioredoxin [Nitrospinae bacterium]|nr:thioredoxin [Nitrospinota bacterium]
MHPTTKTAKDVVSLSADEFESIALKANKPVLVDFWADWCQPCRMVSPTVEEVAREYGSKILVGKLNVDDYPQIAGQYGIRSIPALLLFKNGEVIAQTTGIKSKSELTRMIDEYL